MKPCQTNVKLQRTSNRYTVNLEIKSLSKGFFGDFCNRQHSKETELIRKYTDSVSSYAMQRKFKHQLEYRYCTGSPINDIQE